MAAMAVNFYRRPAESLRLIGVTGTNGKTTTTLLLESILRVDGAAVGVIGTLAYRWGQQHLPAAVTTPESLDLQELFHAMREDRVSHVLMEVSSHALALGRVTGVQFDAGIFTNLSQDHLDFHHNLEDYFAAKALLFSRHLNGAGRVRTPVAVINRDDPYGERLCHGTRAEIWRYGIRQRDAEVNVRRFQCDAAGIRAELTTPSGSLELRSALLGRLNLYNVLAAATTALALGIAQKAIVDGVARVGSVDGRLEPVATGRGFDVLVDYAHTPDALEKSLQCVRELTRGRLLVVFGCGGDRDRGKRPLMGGTAAAHADVVIVTSDNPRTEDPGVIIAEIEAGLQAAGAVRDRGEGSTVTAATRRYTVEPDRRQAIGLALSWARPGDLVLIAGKGHETYQIVGNSVLPFDDREAVRQYLQGTVRDSSGEHDAGPSVLEGRPVQAPEEE
jgi:UDP-N-acetylmuramoyl-L-alanyl-D-glutamate--2,6-diaminopimelate ligase